MKQNLKNQVILFLFICAVSLLSCKKNDNEIGQPNHAELISNIENNDGYSFNQTYYVRPPGSTYGTGDGSSWANAFSDLPEDLVRGAKYYLASGNYDVGEAPNAYVWHKFEDEESDDLFIGVYKATTTDHGTNDGWSADLGEGTANIGPISIVTGNYVFDGQVGSKTSGYGIKITTRDQANDEAKLVRFPWNSHSHHVSFNHIDMEHTGNWGYRTLHPAHDAIYGNPTDESVVLKYLYFKNCYIHDAHRTCVTLLNAENVLFEKCYFARSGLHQECSTIGIRESKNIVFRQNFFEDTKNLFFSIRSIENFYIYSNVLLGKTDNGLWEIYSAIEVGEGFGYNLYIYNNTFYNLPGLKGGIRLLVKNAHIYTNNNLWANCKTNIINLDGNHSHNAFYENYRVKDVEAPQKYDENIDEDTKQVLTSNPFVDVENYNFNLSYATDHGVVFDAPFNTDFNGNVRGADGVWDRGAFEYQE